MIPTCISDDIEAAKAVNRRTLTRYALLPNYRNYWKEAGYVEEMEAIETAIAEKRRDDVPQYLSDAGSPTARCSARRRACARASRPGTPPASRTPIIVPSSAAGNQMKAIEELFAALA